MANEVKDFVKNPVDTVGDWVGDVVDFVGDVVGDVVSWFIDIPEIPDIDSQARGALINKESNIGSIPVVYGQRRLGGYRIFVETTGTDNNLMYMCLVFCEGEVESITNIRINDVNLVGSEYEPYVTTQAFVGTDTQSTSSLLLESPSWDASDRLLGLAYLAVKLEFNQDVFSSIPNITADVKGKKLYDPRTATTAYSTNPALCLRDYLTNTRYGKGLASSLIDDTSFSSAANACDEEYLPHPLAVVDIPRFSCNAIISTEQSLFDNVSLLLTAMQGIMPYQNGEYRLKVEDDYASTFDFTTDNIVGGIQFSGASKKKRYNRVTAKFINPDANYQGDSVTWPDSSSTDYFTFLTEDNNVVLEQQIDLSTVTNYYQARNIAKTLCLASRKNAISITFQATSEAIQCSVGDVVTITHPTPAWSSKEFRITRMSINFDGTVNIGAIEHNATVYPWINDKTEPESVVSNLPNPLSVPPVGISIADELRTRNQEAISVLIVDVTSNSPFIATFDVQARKQGDADYINMGQATGSRFELVNVEDNAIYEVRARAVNTLGVRSAFTTGTHQVVGKTAPPEDVTGLSGNVVSGSLLLNWTPVGDLDLSHYRLRYASQTSGVTYRNAITLIDKIPRPANSITVPARTGTYFIKAVDKLGNASINATTVVVQTNISGVEDLETIQTIAEHPAWAGTMDDIVELTDDDAIILNTSILFDELTGLFDDADGLFDGGDGNVDAQGEYYFANSFDFSQVFTVRVTVSGEVDRIDYSGNFDDPNGVFDAREGLFDGDPNAFDTHDVQLQVRTTNDDPAGTPTWTEYQKFVVGDYTCRAMEFRLVLTTLDRNSTPKVSSITVQADMPIRTESEQDVTSGTSAYNVTYPVAFKETPAIGIAAVMQSGDYYEITSKSRTGFTITFKDSGGTIVSRVFDYVARGYGREET